MTWYEEKAARIKAKHPERFRQIYDREGKNLYLERYTVVPRWMTLGLVRVCLHKFHASDMREDGLHDHPWPFATKILSPHGYFEILPGVMGGIKGEVVRLRRPGKWRFYRAKHRHRVELFNDTVPIYPTSSGDPIRLQAIDRPTWTLFIMGPRWNTNWNFYVNGKRYPWREWIAKRTSNAMA